MKQNRNSSIFEKLPAFCAALGGVLAFTIILYGLRIGSEIKDIIKLCVFAGVISMLLGLYFSILDDNVRKMPYFNTIFITDLFLAILFIMNLSRKIPDSFLLLAGLITALLFDIYFGIYVTILIIIFAGIAGGLSVSYLTYLMITGMLLCFMSPYMKRLRTIGPVMIIVLSIQIIVLIINNQFLIENNLYTNVFHEVLVSLIIITGSFLMFKLYKYCLDRPKKDLIKIKEEYTLVEIISEEFPLLKKLKETSPKTFEHALLVSKISGQAAKAAVLNELLAKAGGMYHEIGKLDQDDYLKSGIKYAEEYNLPEEVIDIVRGHNLKYSKPISPEGAVVSLAVSVLSAKEYLRRNLEETRDKEDSDLNILMKKGVEEIFQMRLNKNSLDESGLTIKQFHKLKEFFLRM